MPHIIYPALAIPFFLFFIGLEYYYARKKGKKLFHFAESVANLNVGIAERLTDIFTMLPFYYFFDYLYTHYALFHFSPGFIAWAGLFLITDFVWYWYHRMGHRVNILWAAHVVHHQSEDFNYTTSVRITVFQAVARCVFWSVLPLMGFPAPMIAIFLLIHGTYPFFTHTQTIGKLGWLEKILVTPTHHGVHHSSDAAYLDKNYGDILIIWDKIFGTFAEEKHKPRYGLTKPLNSYSFLWQHFHYPLELLVAVKREKGLVRKLKMLFGKPDDLDPRIRLVLEKKFIRRKIQSPATGRLKQYILLQTCISLSLLFTLLICFPLLESRQVGFLSVFILLSLINTGAILEKQSWIFYLEFLRMLVPLAWIWTYHPDSKTSIGIMLLLFLLVYFFRPMERRYRKLLYHQA